MNNQPRVTTHSLSKSYGGVKALQSVEFSLEPGEVHALCGENGAGKSTLIKILSGSCVPDSGKVWIEGVRLQPGSVAASEAAGIAVLHQESTAFLHLNTEDNIFVGREPRRLGGLALDRASMRRQTRRLLDRLGERFDLGKPLSELTVAERQMVGIARALSQSCRVLIMDEPTASLSERETEVLFGIIRQLRADGVSILYVSHRLEEVFELADRVSVLRDGKLVGTCLIGQTDREALIRMMVGREKERGEGESWEAGTIRPSPARLAESGKRALEVEGLSQNGVFGDVSFSVRAGEIVGLSGLVGSGRSEVAQALFGIRRPDSGTVSVSGKSLALGSTHAAMQRGISLVPEDRQHQGLVLPLSVGANLTLAILPTLTRRGLLSKTREQKLIEWAMRDLAVRAPSASAPVNTLSGGNQQKVLLGKWLASSPGVLILDEPTRGIDVGAKAEVHRLVRRLAQQGVAILLISSELPEILSLSDRILVMRDGTLSGELSREEADEERVLKLALPEEKRDRESAELEGERARTTHPAWASLTRGFGRLARQREYGVLALLALTVITVALVNPSFLSAGNLRDMLVNCAPAVIVACGLTLVIVTREIDISVGSLMGLTAAVVGILTSTQALGWPVPIGVVLALLLGAGVGLLNGLLVTLGRVPSIIVTLGMLTALRGVTEVVMGGEWITHLPPALRYLGTGAWWGIPICLWTAVGVILLTDGLARWTPLGRRIYAVGSNPHSAALVGISLRRTRMFAFTYAGLLTGVATLVSVPRLSVIESGIGVGFELLVVTCVVVGGTSISGGRGSVFGSVLGALLMGIVSTVLIFLRLGEMSTYWERAIQGGFILAAVLVDYVARQRGAREGCSP